MSNGFQGSVVDPINRSGYNGSGSTIPKGTLVALNATSHLQIEAVNAIADVVYGVAAEDIPNLSRGLVQVGGVALVLAHATLTLGGIVTAHTNGRAINAATGGRIVGIALEVGASGVLTQVELAGPAAGLSP